MDTTEIDISKIHLSKDNLKDCNIGLRCESDYSESFLYNRIQEAFPEFQKIFLTTEQNGETTLSKYFLSDGRYKVLITESHINFNIVSSYPGWDAYECFVIDIINLLGNHVRYLNCQLEYASFHEGLDIFSKFDGIVKFNQLPQIFDGTTLSFNCSATPNDNEDFNVDINVLLRQGIYLENNKCSLTAIKVETPIFKNPQLFEAVKEWINLLHGIQKDLYFKIMDKEYIMSNL